MIQRRLLIGLTGWAVGVLPAPLAAQTAWEAKYVNPKPAPDDLLLPLPCGGAMAFRPVVVPSGPSLLDDRAIELGNPEAAAQDGFNDYQRGAFLAAPFPQAGGGRAFYLGKYTVTVDQYAAVMAPACPQPSAQGRAAKAEISWFEAVTFSERLSSWLLANAPERLPRRGAALAYARLPTEAEWEYAARGGAAVSATDYLAPTWPMPEGPERYAIAGAGMASGRPQQVGQLLPNPLGLHDMLGNVEQWVLEPYRLNRVGRLQGMAGGLIARGGSYATPLESLRTSMRSEIPPFDAIKKQPTRLSFVGFRVALSTVAGGGLADVTALRQAFESAQGSHGAAGSDPAGLIAQLKQQTASLEVRQGLDVLAAHLASDERARNDARAETLRAELNAATALCYVVWRVQKVLVNQQALAADPSNQQPYFAAQLKDLRAGIALNINEQRTALDAYGALLRQMASAASAAELAAAADIVRQDMTSRADNRRGFLTIAQTHAQMLGTSRPVSPETMLHDIIVVPQQAPLH